MANGALFFDGSDFIFPSGFLKKHKNNLDNPTPYHLPLAFKKIKSKNLYYVLLCLNKYIIISMKLSHGLPL